jgi:hypothetical protein
MKDKYDFSKGKRGAVIPSSGNKVRITIRLDRDINRLVQVQGGGKRRGQLSDHVE